MENLQRFRVIEWFDIKGDENLRLNYDLNEDSVVFDVGGYRGDWADAILKRYNCHIFIFEPIESFFLNIQRRFQDNLKVKVFNFGLGSKSEKIQFSLDQDGTSRFGQSAQQVEGNVVGFNIFLGDHSIERIDLIKINIEGGEYDLLPAILSTAHIQRITNLQIQFHDFVPNSVEMIKVIRADLAKTHHPTFSFDFVWENWTLTSTAKNKDLIKNQFNFFERLVSLERARTANCLRIEKYERQIEQLADSNQALNRELAELKSKRSYKIDSFLRKIYYQLFPIK